MIKGENLLINHGNVLLMAIGAFQGVLNLIGWLKHHDTSRNALLYAIHKPRNHYTIISKSILIGGILDIRRIVSKMSDFSMDVKKGLKGLRP